MSPIKLSLLVAAASTLLLVSAGRAQQTIQLVNDNAQSQTDNNVWVLFVGNPANITSGGSTISGMRNLALPTGAVSTAQPANSTTVQSNAYESTNLSANQVMPATPFPLEFISGANNGTTVQVTAYNSATGTFTVANSPALQAQAAGDQFIVGAYSQKLSTLQNTGTISSTLSGQTPNIYNVVANTLDAGVLYISYGQLTYLGSAPAIASSTIPFQTVELTTGTGGGATTSDLTVIDYFAIPIQIQSINQSDASVADTRTFYFKKSTIASGLTAIGATLSNNALYLGPGQVAAGNSGSPSPFPSFQAYLQSLSGNSAPTFSIAGSQNFGVPNPTVVYGVEAAGNYDSTYGYDAKLSEDGSGNFTVTMTPQAGQNTFTPKPAYYPNTSDVQSITINLPKPTSANNYVGYDSIIYGAILDSNSFSINLAPNSPSLTPTTFSGPFTVTSATDGSHFNCSQLSELMTSGMGGLTVQFTSGANNGQMETITSVDSSGNVTLNSAFANTPAANDTFQVLFQVTSASAQNTTTFFGAANLGQSAMNYIAPFSITFVTGANTGTTSQIVALDGSGNATVQTALTNVPQAGDLFSISVPQSQMFTQLYTNSTFSWVVADVLAGLNFGFPGSPTDGTSSAAWYGSFPQEFPYGIARGTSNDGYYNPWAAYFYNASDAYGFAFSDRVAPSPLMSTLPASQNLRITVMPETQLDAPLVTSTNITSSEIDISWPPAVGVTYNVSVLPSTSSENIQVNSAAGTATITGLNSGTPYEIDVQGTNGTQSSLVLPYYATTTGSTAQTSGDVPFGFSFTWAGTGNLPSNYAVYLNGSTAFSLSGNPAVSTSNLAVTGANGSNLYVLDFQDTSNGNKSVYKAVVNAAITGATPEPSPTQFQLNGSPTIYGSTGALNAAPASGPYAITYNPPALPTSPLVLNVNFAPSVRKEFAAVATPTPATSPTATPTPPPQNTDPAVFAKVQNVRKTGLTAAAVVVYRVDNANLLEYTVAGSKGAHRVRVRGGIVRLRLADLPLNSHVRVTATALKGKKKSRVTRIVIKTPA